MGMEMEMNFVIGLRDMHLDVDNVDVFGHWVWR